MQAKLYYFHDPMCSWCWAFSPTLERLRSLLDEKIQFSPLLGGLAADTAAPMPEQLQHRIQDTWRAIAQRVPGTQFNFDFWQQCKPRRSTYPACRAVLAARLQGEKFASVMNKAIQTAYYLRAMNPSDRKVLISLCSECGLDAARFATDLVSATVEAQLQSEIKICRDLGAECYPSLLLEFADTRRFVSVDYISAEIMLAAVENTLIRIRKS